MTKTTNVNAQLQKIADYAVKVAAEKFGQSLDYTENSLASFETLLQQAHEQNSSQGSGKNLSEEAVQKTARVWGSYLGELMRRKWGGEWVISGTDAKLTINGKNYSPIQQVYQRITNGQQYDTRKYIADIALEMDKGKNNNTLLAEAPTSSSNEPAVQAEPPVDTLENEKTSETTKKCPYCKKTLKEDAFICRYCGREVNTDARFSQASSRVQLISDLGRMKGEIILLENQLREYEQQLNDTKSAQKTMGLIWLLIAISAFTGIGLIVAIPLAIFAYIQKHQNEKLQLELTYTLDETKQELLAKQSRVVSIQTQLALLDAK